MTSFASSYVSNFSFLRSFVSKLNENLSISHTAGSHLSLTQIQPQIRFSEFIYSKAPNSIRYPNKNKRFIIIFYLRNLALLKILKKITNRVLLASFLSFHTFEQIKILLLTIIYCNLICYPVRIRRGNLVARLISRSTLLINALFWMSNVVINHSPNEISFWESF